ncbi:MAG: type I secretion system permease/ATPase [Acaryochloris sp. RU_4_1]|nr:type I secretion system permease/ATPase [Acaryochloris sp. RU_4_1]
METNPPLIAEFLATVPGFAVLSETQRQNIAHHLQPLRYPLGRTLLIHDYLPTHLYLVYKGQVRLIGHDPRTDTPETLSILQPGDAIGHLGLLRQVPCETAIASTDTLCFTLPADHFLHLMATEAGFAAVYRDPVSLVELFELLGHHLARQANGGTDLKTLSLQAHPQALARTLAPGFHALNELEGDYQWFVSTGEAAPFERGSCLPSDFDTSLKLSSATPIRLVGVPLHLLQDNTTNTLGVEDSIPWDTIPEGPPQPPEPTNQSSPQRLKYPFFSGRGPIDAPLACFTMLAQHLNLPFRRDVIRRILVNQQDRQDGLSLATCGAIAEMMGLRAHLSEPDPAVLGKLPTPALMLWQDSIALLYETGPHQIVLAVPDYGLVRKPTRQFIQIWEPGPVLLLEKTEHTPQKRFGLSWFAPAVKRFKVALFEVLFASLIVQLFSLANPLVTQIIIDKVIVQNSPDTLHLLGILLLGFAVFEAILSSFRTYLFVDTTNRIDMSLGSQVIDHLLRLPLKYFDKRPVGELSTRLNELENIRQFLTGTALTVVMDALFSVVYIVVMVAYSLPLTLVALATVPLFALLTLLCSPIIRKQTRIKAERNAETQSYLVEVLSGIQTVKAQNIELKSRWQWQERYARYVSAGFDAVITATAAGSMSSFLNKLSSLLLLWVGAYLVLQGQLTLGELIAFRIIAGYTTSPLLRLIQLWQNFQETALSLERLADILDHPQEAPESDRDQIPLPPIQGTVTYRDITFQFKEDGPQQLKGVSFEVQPGTFVGIVGQSGSGKSTLLKLLMRLYAPQQGQILVDNYDVSKVELYSLRSQVGMVLQDSILFDGSVRDNIALSQPDATDEEIIAAAQVAFAHDFIMQLPQGYNTRVGERGSALSGGQRQRIAIARAVLQNPRLLILDEATSALDFNAERQVCQNLSQAFRDRSVFFITHRLGSLKLADHVLMMDQGRIVEQGTHDQLLEMGGAYATLFRQQEVTS